MNAQSTTALYIPGFDPQPLIADVGGVGSGDHTTWLIHAGKPTGTEDPSDFQGTGSCNVFFPLVVVVTDEL